MGGRLNFLLKVDSDVAKLFFNVTNDFSLGCGREAVAALGQDLREVCGQVTAGHINTINGVRERETLINRNNVGNTITRIKDNTGGTAGSVEGQDGLDGDVEGRSVESFEDNLRHLLPVRLRVHRRLSKQNGVLLRGNTEFVVESVMPDLLHVIPVRDDTVLDGVSESKDTSLGLRLITDVRVLLAHTNHNTIDSSLVIEELRGKGGDIYP